MAAPAAPPDNEVPTKKMPEWLSRVETDETRALLRAASEFARTGYAPFLQKAKGAGGEGASL